MIYGISPTFLHDLPLAYDSLRAGIPKQDAEHQTCALERFHPHFSNIILASITQGPATIKYAWKRISRLALSGS